MEKLILGQDVAKKEKDSYSYSGHVLSPIAVTMSLYGSLINIYPSELILPHQLNCYVQELLSKMSKKCANSIKLKLVKL